MQSEQETISTDLNWIDLLLECIEIGISAEQVRSFIYNCSTKDPYQN